MISLTRCFPLFLCFVLCSLLFLTYSSTVITIAQDLNYNQKSLSPINIPTTISNESQIMLKNLSKFASILTTPSPDDYDGWKNMNQQISFMFEQMSQPIVDNLSPNITAYRLGNASILDIKPVGWTDNDKVLVYVHGGGFAFLSANSTLGFSVPVANSTGLRTISVDYSLSPFSKWDQTTNEIISVIQALTNESGYTMKDIGLFGDSAGAGIIAGTIHKMRDMGIGIPSAVVLWSPWIDITGKGDTYITLDGAEPFSSYNLTLRNMAYAYADLSDHENPYVSAIYGNFSEGFPPTLIQGGTKEILLSDFVRLYQSLDQAGIPVKLDIYEGMPHVFQSIMYGTPESTLALSKMNDFLYEHLVKVE